MYSMSHSCSCCNYHTPIKANYQKHLTTQKHILKQTNVTKTDVTTQNSMDTDGVNPKSPKSQPIDIRESTSPTYVCKYCEQCFKFKQSMYRHIKYSCMKNKYEDFKNFTKRFYFFLKFISWILFPNFIFRYLSPGKIY